MSKKGKGGASKSEGSTEKKQNSEQKPAEQAAQADGDQSKPEQPELEAQDEMSFEPETVDTGLDGISAVQESDGEPEVEYKHEVVGDNPQSEGFIAQAPEFVSNVEGDKPPKADENYILISEEEKEEIRKEARAMAKEESCKKAREKFMEDELRKARVLEDAKQGIVTEEPMVKHRVNLAQSAAFHLINGKQYFHGHVYTVPKSLADDMRRTEYCGHVQEDIRKGNNRNEYGLVEREGLVHGPAAHGGGVQRPGGVLRA